MQMTGAQILVETLIEQQVDTVFAYPGGSVINIFDALGMRSDDIQLILPAHEQGGAHAADGYARISGKTGVVISTSGPGATNLVTGIANAYMDSIPMVAITGNVSLPLIGRDSFQEIDICSVTQAVTKHNFFVQDITRIADIVKEAFVIANSGRPGPVLVDIPKDVTAASCEYVPAGKFVPRVTDSPQPSRVKQAADMIAKSQRPLLYCGGGVVLAGASHALQALCEKGNIPIAASLMGLTALPRKHSLMLGMIGMHGTPTSNFAAEQCDLLICVGSRFSDRVAGDRKRFAPNARFIHIDIDPSEFDKNVVCDLHVCGDANTVLEQLIHLIPQERATHWLDEINHFKAKHPMPEEMDCHKTNPRSIIRMIHELAGDDAIIVTDVGQHQMWTAQYYPFSRPRSFVTSGGLGAMGFGLGAAVGAKSADPARPVVLVTGDGSFHMNLAELSTAISSKLPVIVIVMNNGVLGMVRQWQSIFYESRYALTTTNRQTDFAKVSEAFGGLGFQARTMDEARSALTEALQSNRTCVIDCVIDPDEKVFPMIPPGKSGQEILYSEER